MKCFKDRTKEFDKVEFGIDMREFLIFYIEAVSCIVANDELDEEQGENSIALLIATLRYLKEEPDKAREKINKNKSMIDAFPQKQDLKSVLEELLARLE